MVIVGRKRMDWGRAEINYVGIDESEWIVGLKKQNRKILQALPFFTRWNGLSS